MKVRITSGGDIGGNGAIRWWYHDQVGQEFDVVASEKFPDQYYEVQIGDKPYRYHINQKDCVVIEHGI